MGKSDRATRAVSFVLFLALVSYIGVYIYRAATGSTQTVLAVKVTLRESAPLTGIVVREERILQDSAAFVDVTAAEGSRVSAGQQLAVSYQSEKALERATRIRELELEIARVETLLSGLSTAEDLVSRDAAVREAVLGLSTAIARGELSELDAKSLGLRSLVFEDAGTGATAEELASLKSELVGLKSGASSDTRSISAPMAGLYSGIIDGYEHLSPEMITGLTPETLRYIFQDRSEPRSGAIGKLVTSGTWYYAAIADTKTIFLDGESRITDGDNVALEFGRSYNTDITARVVRVYGDVDGECVIVFSCNQALADTLAMRQAAAEVIFREYTGIRVPTEAIYDRFTVEDDEGGVTLHAYVYTLTGIRAERKLVEIIYEAEDFCLVAAGRGANDLKDGNELIVSGSELYDGMVIG